MRRSERDNKDLDSGQIISPYDDMQTKPRQYIHQKHEEEQELDTSRIKLTFIIFIIIIIAYIIYINQQVTI